MSIDHEASPSVNLDPETDAPDSAESDDETADVTLTERVDRVLDWIADHWPALIVGVGVFAYFWYMRHLSLEIHRGYGTSAFDIGVFDQGVWKLSRFQSPEVTITGRNLFADHTSFTLALVAPLYWVLPHASTLLAVQAAVIALAAVPIYLVGRPRVGAPLASVLALAYLLHPALARSNLENYHPDSFMALFTALALYAAIENKHRLFIVMCALCLLTKEDSLLIVLPLAIWFAWRRNLRTGLIVAAAAGAYTWLSFKIIRSFNHGLDLQGPLRIPFGGTLGGLFRTTYRQPGDVLDHLKSEERPWYLWQMLAPTAFVFLIQPEIAAIGVLILLWNITSTFPYQHLIGYHYGFAVIPVLAMGTVWGVARLRTQKLRIITVTLVAVSSLWTAYLWGPFSWSRYKEPAHWGPSHPTVVQWEEIRKEVPSDGVLTAYHSFVPHVDHRQRVYMWPVPWRAAYWGILDKEGQQLDFTSDIEYLWLPTTLAKEDQELFDTFKDQFEVVVSNEGATLHKRVRPG